MWKLTGIIERPVEDVLATAFSIDMRLQNDGNLVQVQAVDYLPPTEKYKHASAITCEYFHLGSLLNDRYLVFAGSIKQETIADTGFKRYIVARKTIDRDVQLLESARKNSIRGDCVGGYIFEQADSENKTTRYYECGWIDLKGAVPAWMWNIIVSTRGTAYHDGLKRGVELVTDTNHSTVNSGKLLQTLLEYNLK